MSAAAAGAARAKVLGLYRSFLREARRMPTENRASFVRRKVRSELEEHRAVADASELEQLLALAEFQLETVVLQHQHLNKLKAMGALKC